MSTLKFVKHEKVSLRLHPELDEKWVQDRVAEDPSILGLGDVFLRDKERIQPKAGRLDILLQNNAQQRYEVEIQLGKTDESHIIRTIEYWDIESKRYPQYDHCAVIVAEDVTSRFLNVISLFNRAIPLIAIQMNAIKIDSQVALVFTTVVDLFSQASIDEDEAVQAPATREYWEQRASKATVAIADEYLRMIKQFAPSYDLKYNKPYIGLAKDGKPNNFVYLIPGKSALNAYLKLDPPQELLDRIGVAGLDFQEFSKKNGRSQIRTTVAEINKHQDLISDLLKLASGDNGGG